MANVLKTLATTLVSTSNLVTTVAVRSESIVDHSLGALDDLAANMHDYTTMSKLSDMTTRREKFMQEHADIKTPGPALQALLDMEVK